MASEHRISMGPRDALMWIKLGIENGRYDAAIGLIDTLLEQLPAGTEFCRPAQPDEGGEDE